MSLALVLVALAIVLLPVGRGSATVASDEASPPGRSAGSARSSAGRARTLTGVAVVAAGSACVVLWGPVLGVGAASVIGPVVVFGARALRRRTVAGAYDPSLPLAVDLVAAALRAGRPLSDALVLAVPAAAPATRDALTRVAGLLRLGAAPDEAWAVLARDGPLGPVAAVAVRSATSGVRLANSFERLAGQLRDESVGVAAARAQRAGVRAMGPLAACFLPSFVCLGVVPVIVGVARTALRGVLP